MRSWPDRARAMRLTTEAGRQRALVRLLEAAQACAWLLLSVRGTEPAGGRACAGQAADVQRATAAIQGQRSQRGLQLAQLRLAAQRRRARRRRGDVQRSLYGLDLG